MAISGTPRSTQGVLANADATFLAASATVDRYIKSMHFANATASTVTISAGVVATLVGATGAIAFGKPIAANDRLDIFFGGDGIRVTNTIIRAFSNTATAVNLTINYVEVLL